MSRHALVKGWVRRWALIHKQAFQHTQVRDPLARLQASMEAMLDASREQALWNCFSWERSGLPADGGGGEQGDFVNYAQVTLVFSRKSDQGREVPGGGGAQHPSADERCAAIQVQQRGGHRGEQGVVRYFGACPGEATHGEGSGETLGCLGGCGSRHHNLRGVQDAVGQHAEPGDLELRDMSQTPSELLVMQDKKKGWELFGDELIKIAPHFEHDSFMANLM